MLLAMISVAYFFILKGLKERKDNKNKKAFRCVIIGLGIGLTIGIFISTKIQFQKFTSGQEESLGWAVLLILISSVIGGLSGLLIYSRFKTNKMTHINRGDSK